MMNEKQEHSQAIKAIKLKAQSLKQKIHGRLNGLSGYVNVGTEHRSVPERSRAVIPCGIVCLIMPQSHHSRESGNPVY